jgi:DNA-binding transcriptional ArsR family regulator
VSSHFTPEGLAEIAERFRALGEPARLAILDALRDGERTVGELTTATGQGQANVSRHLAVLHAAGFVRRRRDGNFVRYCVADPSVLQLCDLVCGRIERGAEALAERLRG